MLKSAPKQAIIIFLIVTSLVLLSLAPLHSSFSVGSQLLGPGDASSEDAPTTQIPLSLSTADLSPFLSRHVAVAKSFAHSEVYEPFASTLHPAMATSAARQLPASLKIYASKGSIVSLLQRVGIFPFGSMRPSEQLAKDICSSTLYKDDPGAMIDLIVLGTCGVD